MIEKEKKSLDPYIEAMRMGYRFQQKEEIIRNYTKEKLIKITNEPIPIKGTNIKKLMKLFEEKYLPFCVSQSNPKYVAFPDSGNSTPTITADILNSFINQNLIADVKSAPIGTYIEIQVLQWFRKLIGYKTGKTFPMDISEVGGIFCTGGVMANVSALLVARSKLFNESFRKGIPQTNVHLLVPEQVDHYSASLAMSYLGFGSDKLVPIKLDKEYNLDLDDLKKKIKKVLKKNGKILAVIAYAGDSRTMQVYKLKKIVKICKKYSIWFHLDACHGFQLLFSKKYKKKLEGIHLCDSVTCDPHKVLMTSYPSSLVLFKNAKDLMCVSKNYDMTISNDSMDLGQITPFIGSKSFHSLKLWFLLKNYGTDKLGKIIEKRINLAKFAKKELEKNKDIVIFHDVNINSICFAYLPKCVRTVYTKSNKEEQRKIEQFSDNLNKNIHDKIYYGGKFCIHTFKLKDNASIAFPDESGKHQVLGMILGNPLTRGKDIRYIIKEINRIGKEEYEKLSGELSWIRN